MSFLKFDPSVFIIGEEYEILLLAKENGILSVSVGEKIFHEENTGVLSTEKYKARIRIPIKLLDEACEYTVIYRKTIERKGYFSRIEGPQTKSYVFRPLKKDGKLNIYNVSDVHYRFEPAIKAAGYFGDNTDLFIVNGDIGEVETVENYEEVARFCANIAHGSVPIVFIRGNHDTRGHLAELYSDYFPANGKDTFYTFRAGFLYGIVLDLGEDKPDSCPEYTYPEPDVYGGVNVFSEYRAREDKFIEALEGERNGEIAVALCHIPTAFSNRKPGTVFDIERERYARWSAALDKLGVRFMLSGHYHSCFVVEEGDERSTAEHTYPIIIGSEPTPEGFIGAAIELDKSGIEVRFTDENRNTVGTYSYKFK